MLSTEIPIVRPPQINHTRPNSNENQYRRRNNRNRNRNHNRNRANSVQPARPPDQAPAQANVHSPDQAPVQINVQPARPPVQAPAQTNVHPPDQPAQANVHPPDQPAQTNVHPPDQPAQANVHPPDQPAQTNVHPPDQPARPPVQAPVQTNVQAPVQSARPPAQTNVHPPDQPARPPVQASAQTNVQAPVQINVQPSVQALVQINVHPPVQAPKQQNNNANSIRSRINLQRAEEDRAFVVGYRGEAHIYEMLKNDRRFKNVVWNAMSKDEKHKFITTSDGHKYFIKEGNLHYDIYAEDENGEKYFFEVKSTNLDSKYVMISSCQMDFAQSLINENEHHIVAVVFNVNESPSVVFYKKMTQI